VYKYVPYGRVKLVIPYLVRRAQENSGMMTTGAAEKKLLSIELRRRIKNLFSLKGKK
jgi:proline dehydrogenase